MSNENEREVPSMFAGTSLETPVIPPQNEVTASTPSGLPPPPTMVSIPEDTLKALLNRVNRLEAAAEKAKQPAGTVLRRICNATGRELGPDEAYNPERPNEYVNHMGLDVNGREILLKQTRRTAA